MIQKIKQLLAKRINVILGVGVGLSLAVLFYIGRYSVMASDDYSYGLEPRKIWLATGSLWEVIRTAFKTIALSREAWQGTYTSIFLMGLNPGILNERCTVFVSFIILIPYCVGIGFFFKQLGKKLFIQDKAAVRTISLCTLFITIQTFYDPSEAVYWYNGAIHYMFIQSLLLGLFGVLLKLDAVERYRHKNWIWVIIGGILAIVVAGGNFISVLQGLIVMTAYFVVGGVMKKINWQCLIPYVVFVGGALYNLAAPGNAVRKEVSVGYTPVKSIFASLQYGIIFMGQWTTLLFVVSLLLLVPFIWRAMRGTKVIYQYPLLFVAFSYGVFSAMFTPLFYGMGDVYVDRALNIVKWMYYVICVVDLIYVLGWLRYNVEHSTKEFFADVSKIVDICRKYRDTWISMSVMAVLMIFALTPDKNAYTSISAVRSLVLGEASAYHQEQLEREELYYDDSQTVLYLESIENRPYVLFHGDLYPDDSINYWINTSIAQFYGKKEIHLREE